MRNLHRKTIENMLRIHWQTGESIENRLGPHQETVVGNQLRISDGKLVNILLGIHEGYSGNPAETVWNSLSVFLKEVIIL